MEPESKNRLGKQGWTCHRDTGANLRVRKIENSFQVKYMLTRKKKKQDSHHTIKYKLLVIKS